MTHASDDLKLKAIQHYLKQSRNYEKTARIFQCSVTSLKRWVERYQSTGSVSRKIREYTAYKVKRSHLRRALQILKKHPTISMKSLAKRLRDEFEDFSITSQWLDHVLKDNNQTRKRTRHYHEPETRFRKPINIKAELQKFYCEMTSSPG